MKLNLHYYDTNCLNILTVLLFLIALQPKVLFSFKMKLFELIFVFLLLSLQWLQLTMYS